MRIDNFQNNMKEKIEYFLDYLTKITQDESDFIFDVLHWGDETKIAFKFAKKIFEDEK